MENKNKLISFTMEPLELPCPSARNQINIWVNWIDATAIFGYLRNATTTSTFEKHHCNSLYIP
jgi:hypothetical protein